MNISYGKIFAAASSLGATGLALWARNLPSYLDDSTHLMAMFLVHEFRFEIWGIAVVVGLLLLVWSWLSKEIEPYGLRIYLERLFAQKMFFGKTATLSTRCARLITFAVFAIGTSLVLFGAYKIIRSDVVYFRDKAERKFAQYLLKGARAAQASYDFPRAMKLFKNLETQFTYFEPTAKKEIEFIQAQIDTSKRVSDVADDEYRRFGYTPDVIQKWAEALLLNPRDETLRSKLSRALDSSEQRALSSQLSTSTCERVRRAQKDSTPLSDGDLKSIRRLIDYYVSDIDRSRLLRREFILLTAISLCESQVEGVAEWGVWDINSIRNLLEVTETKKLIERGENFIESSSDQVIFINGIPLMSNGLPLRPANE